MYRNGNYTAFYVDEPFKENNLGAQATEDFIWYNLLRAWTTNDNSFPFVDSHNKTYNVRDDSDWEKTLKPRLRERLRNSKNIILILSSITKNSKALKEEIDYGINILGLPIIIIYPDFEKREDIYDKENDQFHLSIKFLWESIPILKSSMNKVPTLHIPFNKETIKLALNNEGYMVQTKKRPGRYYYKF